MAQQNTTEVLISKTQLNGREGISLTREEAVKLVEAFNVSARGDLRQIFQREMHRGS